MLPSEWELNTVDDLFNVHLGKMLNQAAKTQNPQYNYLGNSDVKWGCFDFSQLKSMHFNEREIIKFTLQVGDILMCEGGEVGRCSIWKSEREGVYYQKALHRLRSKGGIIPEFFYNFMSFIAGTKALDDFTTRTSIAHLTREKLLRVPIKTPPLPEQRKIAKILSTWDKAISTAEHLIDNSKQQKKALMQQLLTGEKRMPGSSVEWNTKQLGEIGEIKSAGVDKKTVDGEKPVRLLNFTDVFKKSFIFSNELNHWVTAPKNKVINCDVKRGDVFFTPSSETRADTGIPSVIEEDIDDCCYSYHVIRFRIQERWDLNFKAYAFTTPQFKSQLYKLADGSGQRYVVSQDGFRSIAVTYPSYEEQVFIGKIIRSADQEVVILQQKLNHLKEEKKALMQQLLTGKRRVKTETNNFEKDCQNG